MKMGNWSGVLIALFVSTPSAAERERVYFCLVDQIVGLQFNKQDSGKIAIGDKSRFKMTYRPPRILFDAADPVFSSPTLVADIAGRGKADEYVAFDSLTAFSNSSAGMSTMSNSGVMIGQTDKAKAKADLIKQIESAKAGAPMGYYPSYSGFFGNQQIQLMYRSPKVLQGIYSTVGLVDREKNEKSAPSRALYGYMTYFTCEDF